MDPNRQALNHLGAHTRRAILPVWVLDYPDGAARRLTNDLEGYFWLSLSADGRMLVTRQQRTIARVWMLADGDIKTADS